MDKQQLFKISGINPDDDFKTVKNKLKWQTRGKTGTGNLRWVRLIDCDTNHLENIIYNVPQNLPTTKKVILSILKDRWTKEDKKKKLKKKHIEEIKQLLKEFRNITDIKNRIQEWRDEGYNVDELEQMIEFVGIDKSEIEKYCSDCGRTVPDDANICPYCGLCITHKSFSLLNH